MQRIPEALLVELEKPSSCEVTEIVEKEISKTFS